MPRAAPRHYHHGNLRQALLDAAERILEREGPGALALRRIARDAGVTHAAVYHHFGSLEDLLLALTAQGFDAFGAALEEAVAGRPGMEGVAEMGVGYVRFAARRPALFRLLFGPESAGRQASPEVAAAATRAFEGLVQAARSAGPGDEEEVRRRAVTAWALVHGLSSLLVNDLLLPLGFRLSQHEALARAVLGGGGPPPPGGQPPAAAPAPAPGPGGDGNGPRPE